MALRTLVIFRHAKSDHPVGMRDHDRPLTARGERDARAAGRWLRDHVGVPDLVVCSTARRARETWDAAAGELAAPAAGRPDVRHEERVYDATADALLDVVREQPDEARSLVLVGHNPGLQMLVSALTREGPQIRTSTLAVVRWEGTWADAGRSDATLDAWEVLRGPRP